MLILSLNDLYWGLPAVLRQYIIDEYFSLQILLWEVMNVLDNHKGLMGCYQRTADPKIKECFDIIHLFNPFLHPRSTLKYLCDHWGKVLPNCIVEEKRVTYRDVYFRDLTKEIDYP